MLVYLIKNLVSGKMYIGQTTRTLEERLHEHYFRDYPIGKALKKYGFNGFSYNILKCSSLEEMNAVEEHLISIFDSCNPELGYNLSSGGLNNRHTSETKGKISKANKGRKMTKAQIDKGVKARKSRPRTEAEKRHLQTLHIKAKGNKYGLGNTSRRKSVLCIDTGEVFESAYHAGIFMGAKDGSLISKVCNGKKKSAYGYTWEYL